MVIPQEGSPSTDNSIRGTLNLAVGLLKALSLFYNKYSARFSVFGCMPKNPHGSIVKIEPSRRNPEEGYRVYSDGTREYVQKHSGRWMLPEEAADIAFNKYRKSQSGREDIQSASSEKPSTASPTKPDIDSNYLDVFKD